MKIKKRNLIRNLVFVVTFFLALPLLAQENCTNGIDDDGDGFVDCFDPDCINKPGCVGFYIGNDASCTADPVEFPKFSMKLKWGSPDKTTNHLNRVNVGDLDRDGVPEVIATEIIGKKITILNGSTGAIKKQITVTYSLDRDAAIANINNTSCGQIFTTGSVSGNWYIYAYDCNLNLLWSTRSLTPAANSFAAVDQPYTLGIADFDGDGKIEIYYRDEIIDAHTGIRLVKGNAAVIKPAEPVAANILGDSKLELISGCSIYQVNFGARTKDSGSLTLLATQPSFFLRKDWTSTSIADYNQDGFLDVIASGSDGGKDVNTTIFFWDVKNNVLLKYKDFIAGSFTINGCPPSSGSVYSNGWQNGTGRVNIADIDGDGKLNATYVSGKFLYALKEDFTLLWRVVVNEETSGYTGCTVYDFNGDGAAEVVYRDEQYLYIINGNDGSINTQNQCIARTQLEYPVVADVDADGATEICVTCGTNDALAWANFCDLNYSQNAQVRVFNSAGQPWVPSRKLWNQHAYFNVNVNDDLTIPKQIQAQQTVFSNDPCAAGNGRALNTFLNQTPFLNSRGCPQFVAPDLQIVNNSLILTPPTCPQTAYKLALTVTNQGDAGAQGNLPITFYNGDPMLPGAIKLNTEYLAINLNKGDVQNFTNVNVSGTGGNFELYIVLNDAGTTVPTPIVLPNSNFLECNYSNVYHIPAAPLPGTVVATKIKDNIKCIGATVPDNGAAQAYVDEGGTQNTTDYSFSWYIGAVDGTPDYVGSTYTGLSAGTYNVVAQHNTAGCSTSAATVVIIRADEIPLDVAINNLAPNSSCIQPDGQMQAVVNGGAPAADFTFAWYEGNDIFTAPQVASGDIGTGLKGNKTYTVLVTSNSSGCQNVASKSVTDVTVLPVLSTSTVNAFCLPANSGSATALVGGIATGFTFKWYDGVAEKPSADFTGSAYTNLVPGSYTVTATNDVSQCVSTPVTVAISLPPVFVVSTNLTAQQTSCAVAAPNGSASADVGGVTAGYTFQWFAGQSTLPADAIPGTISATNLEAGTFTVIATDNTTQCSATGEVTVTQNLVLPVIASLTPSANTICDIAITGGTFDGSAVADATYNGNPVLPADLGLYTFVWHDGSAITDPVIAGVNSISQKNGGDYTLEIKRNDTQCSASPQTVTILNNFALPVLTTAATGSTNCSPGLENGSALITFVDAVAVGATSNYTYSWTGPASFPVSVSPNNANQATLIKVQGGAGYDYLAEVTNKSTGCKNTASVNVPDLKELPVITLTTVGNSICDPALATSGQYNGSVTVSTLTYLGGAPYLGSDVTYKFWQNATGTGVPTQNTAATIFANQNGGNYSASATITGLGCTSSVVPATILNNPTLPVVATASQASTNCVAGKEDGFAQVTTVDGVLVTAATGYSYSWTGPVAPAFPVSNAVNNANTFKLIKLQGGTGYDYTVVVTAAASGCQSTEVVNVQDNKKLPALSLASNPNNICTSTAAHPFVGSLTASVTNFPGSVPADFTYVWNTAGSVTQTLSALDVGIYSVVATHTSTGCASANTSGQVLSTKVLPVLAMSSTPSTNCTTGPGINVDGVATVTVVSPAGPYDYSWYDGSVASGPVTSSTPNSVVASNSHSGVQGGMSGLSLLSYTAEVSVSSTGCAASATVGVADDSQIPVLGPLTPTDNINCGVVKNGAATVTTLSYRGNPVPSAAFGGFTFNWSGGTPSPVQTISALAAGTYSLTVRHNSSGCLSNPENVLIKDDLYLPVINSTVTNQTSCDLATPNGAISVTVNESSIGGGAAVSVGYSFLWSNSATGTTVSNLAGNQSYTVTATKLSTQCSAAKAVFVTQVLTLPLLSLTPTATTTCVPPNGSIQVLVSNNTFADNFDFFRYDGTDAIDEAAVIAGADASASGVSTTFGGLIPRAYTIVAKNSRTKCVSLQQFSTVGNNTPPINVNVGDNLVPANCNTSAGSLKGGVQSVSQLITWDALNNVFTTATPLGFSAGEPITISRNGVNPLPGNIVDGKIYYYLPVTATTFLLELNLGGGALPISAVGEGFISDILNSGLSFAWYLGVPSATSAGLGPINYFTNPPVFPAPLLGTLDSLNNLAPDLYTLEVTDIASGCKAYKAHTLPYLGAHSVLKITKTNSTICPATVGNGSIEIQIEPPLPPDAPPGTNQTNYSIDVIGSAITGFTTAEPVLPFVISSALKPGSYIVKVTELFSGFNCAISQDLVINLDALPPILNIAPPVPNSACDPLAADGRIDVTIQEDSAVPAIPGITYSFDLAPDVNSIYPVSLIPAGAYSAPNLLQGNYSVTITASNNCVITKSVVIPFQPNTPNILGSDVTVTDAEFCDTSLEQSASAVVLSVRKLDGVAEVLNDFEFSWSPGPVAGAPSIYTGIGDNTAAKGGEELSNRPVLPSTPVTNGTYFVTATKKTDTGLTPTGGIGCTSLPLLVTIGDDKILPSVALTPFGDTSCDPTVFEGQIQTTITTASGPGNDPLATYSYVWNPTGNPGQPLSSIGNAGNELLNNINDGVYNLTVTNSITGCSNTGSTTLISTTPPVFTLTASVADLQFCNVFDGAINNAQIQINGAPGLNTDFDFVWFKTNLLPTSVVLDGQNPVVPVEDELSVTTFPAITTGSYFIKAIRKSGGAGQGCESAPLPVSITDKRVNPTVQVTSVASSACDANFDGQITINASTSSGPGVGQPYNLTWIAFPGIAPANASFDPTYSTLSTDLIGPGAYGLTVTNSFTGCATNANSTILQNTIPMVINSVTPTDVDVCGPANSSGANGTATINSILVNNLVGNLTDFDFTWGLDPAFALTIGGNTTSLVNLDFGTYYVTATRKAVLNPALPGVTGSGCPAAVSSFTIDDLRIFPIVTNSVINNSACDGNFDGRITINAVTTGGPGAAATYDLTWTADPDLGGAAFTVANAAGFANSYTTLPTDLVGPGSYDFIVTNNITTCQSSGRADLIQNNIPLIINSVSPTDVTFCSPDNGAATVTSVNSATLADYQFNWDDQADMLTPIFTNLTTVSPLGVGTFFVQGTRNAVIAPAIGGVTGSGCKTQILAFEIKDAHVNPVIAAETLVADSNCAGAGGAGSILISEGSPLNYTFQWFEGNDSSGAPVLTTAGVNGELVQSLQEGNYFLVFTDNTTSCIATRRFTIDNNPTLVNIAAAGFSAPAISNCDPATGLLLSGSATIADINENGVPAGTANYTFDWTDLSGNPLQIGPLTTFDQVNSGSLIPPGDYLVRATNTLTACFTELEFNIGDDTPGTVNAFLATFENPQICVSPQDGTLFAAASGLGNSFSFEWYPGDQTSGPVGAPVAVTDVFTGFNVLPGQSIVTFTVKVINGTNGCWDLEAYDVPLIQNPVFISASSSPLTFCSTNNGELTATTTNDNKIEYTFDWSIGNVPNTPPDYTGSIVTGLPPGIYTVIATDNADSRCVSAPATTEIIDQLEFPAPDANLLAPQSICDPARPNGVVAANVGGNVADYIFEWYPGSVVSGVPVYIGAEYGNAPAGPFIVRATDIISGCTGTATVDLIEQLDVVPVPDIEILSHVTSCIVDNGQLSVSVGGNSWDYVFDWTDGTNIQTPPDFTGEIYSDLATGFYTVQATSNITGCISAPAQAEILQQQVFAELEVSTDPATCNLDDGYLTVRVINGAELDLVDWFYEGAPVASGPNLNDATAGNYEVKVTTLLGCESDQSVVLESDIQEFNGVSKTPDSHNDIFIIDCIDQFPNNKVEIFNRAGTKVYEGNGYDNTTVYFDGRANHGFTLTGDNLPAGTYFYVINKGDGSPRRAGYLEIVD